MADDRQDIADALVALQPQLRRFAYGLTGTRADADDLVQATYERALARLHQWTPGTRLDSWLYRIMHTIRINQHKSNSLHRRRLEERVADQPRSVDGERESVARLTLEAVRRFIWRLPEGQRVVLLLVAVEGASYKQASDVLGVPIGTVTSRLARARMALKDFVTEGDATATVLRIARES